MSDRVLAPSLYADGRRWQPGDWALLRAGTQTAVVRVTVVDTQIRALTVLDLSTAFPAGPVELQRITSYLTQPQYPEPEFASTIVSSPPSSPPSTSPPSSPPAGDGLNLADGDYLAYLEVWDCEVTALEDPRSAKSLSAGPIPPSGFRTCGKCACLDYPVRRRRPSRAARAPFRLGSRQSPRLPAG